MNAVIGQVASYDAFILKDISFDSVQLILLYFAICSLVLLLSRISFSKIVSFLLVVLIFPGVVTFPASPR